MRLTIKAGKSSAAIGVLPRASARSRAAVKVSSSVAIPRISSTRLITGTGFMKCMPMNLPGRSVDEASRVIEIDEVLVAISASGRNARRQLLEDLALDLFPFGGGFDDHVAIAEQCVV